LYVNQWINIEGAFDIDKVYFIGKSIEGIVMKSPAYRLTVCNIQCASKGGDQITDWQSQVTRDIDQTVSAVMAHVTVQMASKPLNL